MTNVRHPIKFHWNSSTDFDLNKVVVTSVLCSPSEIFFIQFSCVGGFEPCFSGPHKTSQNAKSLNVFLLGNLFGQPCSPTIQERRRRRNQQKFLILTSNKVLVSADFLSFTEKILMRFFPSPSSFLGGCLFFN